MGLATASHESRHGHGIDHGRHVDPRGLDLLQRLLLTTDGTVTQFLAAAMGEPIEAVQLAQHVDVAAEEGGELELRAGQWLLDRRVLLQGATSGRNFLHGESMIALDRVPRAVGVGLLRRDTPIGLLLRRDRTEVFREILWSVEVADPSVAAHFGLPEATPLLARRYRIVIGHRPAMLITETFPRSYGPAPRLRGVGAA